MELKLNLTNPEAITYHTEELAYTILGGIRIEGFCPAGVSFPGLCVLAKGPWHYGALRLIP